MNAPKPLLIIASIAIVGVAGIALGVLRLPERISGPKPVRADKRQVHNLQHLLGSPKRTYLVIIDDSLYPQLERPASFSVNPRPESVLFML